MTVVTFTEHVDPPRVNGASQGSRKAAEPLSRIISARELGAKVFPPIKFIVPTILPEGATLLAGRPKLGKSWMALDIALAVARGDYTLGDYHCPQGDVLYLALEDNQRRLQSRINRISPPSSPEPFPDRLDLATEWPRCDAGGLHAIRAWARSKPSPRLVVVDVLAMFKPGRGSQESSYEHDYAAVKGLQELASELGVGILIVHHVRKGVGDIDPFEKISGTLGLSGAADSAMILDRDGNGCTLYCRGRDIQEYERAISFSKENCRWTIQGDASEVRRTDERSQVLAVLSEATEPMKVTDIMAATEMKRSNLDTLLYRMGHAGEVLRAGRGRYVHPDRIDLTDDES